MNIYTIVLFLHIISAIGVCIGISVVLLGVALLRRAQRVEQVRTILAFATTAFPIAGVSMLLLLAAGFYLALSAWSLRTSWIAVTLVSLLLMMLDHRHGSGSCRWFGLGRARLTLRAQPRAGESSPH